MIYNGDCLDILKTLPDNSVDALVTDPPAGISFMGKEWDHHKGGRKEWIAWLESVMRECMRVLKPGAHGLVWALPRTAHWTATALEDAGFEVRDCITHLFGSGFPKSLDISKAIDKAAGAEREVVGRADPKNPRTAMARAKSYTGFNDEEKDIGTPITEPSTDAAKQWQGFGTALKPAAEFWWLCRKPISEKTVAANVLKWGTGGLNIDGCRIGYKGPGDMDPRTGKGVVFEGNTNAFRGFSGDKKTQTVFGGTVSGRFPANLVFSHSEHCTEDACDLFTCAVKMLDEQSGILKTGAMKPTLTTSMGYMGVKSGYIAQQEASSGGASRFFYCPKVSPSERGESTHPTMKTQKLMRYLCKLVTPPGGTVLDPFMGSGSTGLAAKSEGFQFIGIEREPEYFEIAKARIGE